MILLDLNIPRDQVARLRQWRIRSEQIGDEVGRPAWQDQDEVRRELRRFVRIVAMSPSWKVPSNWVAQAEYLRRP